MTKKELIEYLKDNLKIECNSHYDYYDGRELVIKLTLEGETISESDIDIT